MAIARKSAARVRRAVPLLGPSPEVTRDLVRLPRAKLVAAATARGLPVASSTSRLALALALVGHSARAQAEVAYHETKTSFHSREPAYPAIREACQRAHLVHLLDIGCGPGFFAAELQRSGALGASGNYVGTDVSTVALELARARFADDPRFTFCAGDAERAAIPAAIDPTSVDGVVLAFVISYLDTRAVDRLFRQLPRVLPAAKVVVATTFRSAVDRLHPDQPVDEVAERADANRYLAGDRKPARVRWDVRRFESYRTSFLASYRLAYEQVLADDVQVIWVGAPRRKKSS